MTKLIDKIKGIQTGRRVSVIGPMNVEVYKSISEFYDYAFEMKYGVNLGISSVVRRDSSCTERDKMEENSKMQLIESIYGEIRMPLHEITALLCQRDCDGALRKVQELYSLLFTLTGEG